MTVPGSALIAINGKLRIDAEDGRP